MAEPNSRREPGAVPNVCSIANLLMTIPASLFLPSFFHPIITAVFRDFSSTFLCACPSSTGFRDSKEHPLFQLRVHTFEAHRSLAEALLNVTGF